MATLTETYQNPTQPDISYLPNPEKYALRTQHRVKNENLRLIGLPTGFPQKLVSSFVWEGKDLAREYDSVYALSEQEVIEVERALEHFKCMIYSCASFQWRSELTEAPYSAEQAIRLHQPGNVSFTNAPSHSAQYFPGAPSRPRLQSAPRPACMEARA